LRSAVGAGVIGYAALARNSGFSPAPESLDARAQENGGWNRLHIL
jgi:hypothetical protein